MKKFFKTTANIIKWTFRLGLLGLVVFFIVKYVQAKFYYEPKPSEHLSEKNNYLTSVKEATSDTIVVFDTIVERFAVEVPQSFNLSTSDSTARMDSSGIAMADSLSDAASTTTEYRTRQVINEQKKVLSPPNIILIVFDDLGYGDLGAFGSEAVKTPYIDTLAVQGVKLTSFYAPAGYGTPSRASMLTGRYPFRSGMTHTLHPSNSKETTYLKARNVQLGIMEDEILLAEPLRKAGYATGLVGKWHLGDTSPHLPNDFGFDYFFGIRVSHEMSPLNLYRNEEIILEDLTGPDQLIDGYTEEAVRFIDDHKGSPFFLQLAHSFPHLPLPENIGALSRSRAGLYGDVIEALDKSVGRIVDALNTHGLENKTLIILTSDNGPLHLGSTALLRGRKYEVFEGGVRVPFIAWYPKEIPAGLENDAPAMMIDIFPTIAIKVGVPVPTDRVIDGKDIWPLLTSSAINGSDRSLFFFWKDEVFAVRNKNYKYHINHRLGSFNPKYPLPNEVSEGPWLFDLSYDPSEAYNILDNEKSLAERMDQQIQLMNEEIESNPRGWLQ